MSRKPRVAAATLALAGVLAAWPAMPAAKAPAHAPQPAVACPPQTGLDALCGPVAVEDLVPLPGTPWLLGGELNVGRPPHLVAVDARGPSWREVFPWPGSPPVDPAFRPSRDCPSPPDFARMSLSGVALRPAGPRAATFYAANTGDRRAIELFAVRLVAGAPHLAWRGCLVLPPHSEPNAVAALPGGRVAVSSFFDPDDVEAWAKMDRGEPMGRVLIWSPGSGFTSLDLAPGGVPLSGPNGLETSADGRTLYVSDWGGKRLVIADPAGRRAPRAIALDFLPDNIRRLPDGRLLVGGQRARPLAIHACHGPACPQDWVVALVDPVKGTSREVVARKGSPAVSYAASGLVHRGTLFITARSNAMILYQRGFRLPR